MSPCASANQAPPFPPGYRLMTSMMVSKPQDRATQAAPAPSNTPIHPAFSQTLGSGQSQDGHSPCVPTAAFGTQPCRHRCPGRDLTERAAGPPSSKHVPPSAPVLRMTSHHNRNPTASTKQSSSPRPASPSEQEALGARPGSSELRPAGTWLGPDMVLGLFSLVLWPGRRNPKHFPSLAWEAAAVPAPGKPHETRSGRGPRPSSATLCQERSTRKVTGDIPKALKPRGDAWGLLWGVSGSHGTHDWHRGVPKTGTARTASTQLLHSTNSKHKHWSTADLSTPQTLTSPTLCSRRSISH